MIYLIIKERINRRFPGIPNKVPLGLMIYSDSTNLTVLPNGAKAWIVYLTIVNIDTEVRQSDKRSCIIPIAFLSSPEANSAEKVNG